MGARHLNPAWRVDVREVRAQDLLVAKDVGGDRPAAVRDDQAIGLLVDGEVSPRGQAIGGRCDLRGDQRRGRGASQE